MTYRGKLSGPYAEFIVRDRGPADYPNLTIELDSTYDERFIGLLKSGLRHRSERGWDPDNKKWYIAPAALDTAAEIAKVCFPNVLKTEGETIIDLLTGEQIPTTGNLFG